MNNEEQINPDELENSMEEAIRKAEQLREHHQEQATLAGYIRDSVINFKGYVVAAARESIANPDFMQIATSGSQFSASLNKQLNALLQGLQTSSSGLYDAAGSADTYWATMHSTSVVVTIVEVPPIQYMPSPAHEIADPSATVNRLSGIDPSLGETYQAIWEALYGTTSDPERTALFLIRQTFDHLFGILGPDEEVRVMRPPAIPETDPVTRIERIEYVARTQISDQNRANSLAASAKQLNSTYQQLNILHKRGELDDAKARRALLAMKRMLDEWALALTE